MRKLLKWSLWLILGGFLLIVITIISALLIVDPNDYKDEIAAEVYRQTGRELSINGNINVSYFPWLGFVIEDVTLGNAKGFQQKPFLKIKQANARLKLLSLLSEPEIGELELSGLQLLLQRNARGTTNWQDLLERGKADNKAKDKKAAPAAKSAEKTSLPALRIEGVHVRDARLDWQDQLNNNNIALTDFNADAGPVHDLKRFPISMRFKTRQSRPKMQGEYKLETELNLALEQQQFAFKQLEFDSTIRGPELPQQQIKMQLSTPLISIDLKQEKLQLQKLALQLNDIQARGDIQLSNFSHPYFTFDLHLPELDLNKLSGNDTAAADKKTAAAGSADATPYGTLLEPLKAFAAQGKISVAQLRVANLSASQLKLALQNKNGRLHLQLGMDLYKGHYASDIQLHGKGRDLYMTLRQQLNNVDFGTFMQAISGKASITGEASIASNLSGHGHNIPALKKTLQGDASLNGKNINAKSADVLSWGLESIYKKYPKSRPDEKKIVTVFDTVTATARINHGIVTNNDLLAVSKRVNVKGSGQVSIPAETLNYTVNLISNQSLILSINGKKYDLKDEPIPVNIRGNWYAPTIDSDAEEVFKRFLKRAVEEKKQSVQKKVDKEAQRVEEKLKKEGQRVLDRLRK